MRESKIRLSRENKPRTRDLAKNEILRDCFILLLFVAVVMTCCCLLMCVADEVSGNLPPNSATGRVQSTGVSFSESEAGGKADHRRSSVGEGSRVEGTRRR